MFNTTIRLRDDQRAFIAGVVKVKATDFSEFVRLCVDQSAKAVATSIPPKTTLEPFRIRSMKQLRSDHAKAQKARAR
jgi:hypothetical protein